MQLAGSFQCERVSPETFISSNKPAMTEIRLINSSLIAQHPADEFALAANTSPPPNYAQQAGVMWVSDGQTLSLT